MDIRNGIRLQFDGAVAIVTLDMPPVNALGLDNYQEITRTFDRLGDMASVRAVVLTAAGKAFCAGVDMKKRGQAVKDDGDTWSYLRAARESFYAIRECKKPVVAAINGVALGAGFGLAAHSDILIASENASVGLPEIDVGLMGGGTVVQSMFSPSTARRMMFMGYRMTAAELYRLGLIEACVPPEALMETAMSFARELAAKSPTAMRYAKQTMNTISEMPARESYRFEQNMTAELSKTPDAREAVLAFMEKRAPNFTGS
nr:enoyl-CoA hydratase/isomerase family protein [Mesorhizobium sp.]